MPNSNHIPGDSPYCAALRSIRASDALKGRTLAALRSKAGKAATGAGSAERRKPASRLWGQRRIALGAAACLLLCLCAAGLGGLFRQAPQLEPDDSLPLLTVEALDGMAMGYEGYLAPSIEELDNGNPWTEGCGIEVLPVYENPRVRSGEEVTRPLSGEEMQERARDAAERMGLTVQSVVMLPTREMLDRMEEKTGERADAAPTSAEAVCEGVTIRVSSTGEIELEYEPGLALPKKYTFSYSASRSDLLAATRYLAGAYGALGGLEQPTAVLSADYTYTGQRIWSCRAYDGSGSLLQQILSWNFRYLTFYCNDEGQLWFVRSPGCDLSHKIGNYPILSAEEARQQLLEGRYLTTVPAEVSGENAIAQETIARVELVYRNTASEKIFMPYYRFLVELEPVTVTSAGSMTSSAASDGETDAGEDAVPDGQEGQTLRHYGAYYVPAVEEQYLTGLSLWDGSFN